MMSEVTAAHGSLRHWQPGALRGHWHAMGSQRSSYESPKGQATPETVLSVRGLPSH